MVPYFPWYRTQKEDRHFEGHRISPDVQFSAQKQMKTKKGHHDTSADVQFSAQKQVKIKKMVFTSARPMARRTWPSLH